MEQLLFSEVNLFLGQLSWEGLEPVPIEWIRGDAQWKWSALGGGGTDSLYLRQTEPGDSVRPGHEWDRGADLLHLCYRPQQPVERSVMVRLHENVPHVGNIKVLFCSMDQSTLKQTPSSVSPTWCQRTETTSSRAWTTLSVGSLTRWRVCIPC